VDGSPALRSAWPPVRRLNAFPAFPGSGTWSRTFQYGVHRSPTRPVPETGNGHRSFRAMTGSDRRDTDPSVSGTDRNPPMNGTPRLVREVSRARQRPGIRGWPGTPSGRKGWSKVTGRCARPVGRTPVRRPLRLSSRSPGGSPTGLARVGWTEWGLGDAAQEPPPPPRGGLFKGVKRRFRSEPVPGRETDAGRGPVGTAANPSEKE